jgi:hypothetical protein
MCSLVVLSCDAYVSGLASVSFLSATLSLITATLAPSDDN